MTPTDTAKRVLRDLYGIDAELTRLYGELDDNFLAVTATGEKSVVKIMHEGCDPRRVDLQAKAMAHLSETAGELNLPQVISTMDGRPYAETLLEGVSRLVWSLKYCPGTLIEDVTPHTEDLLRSFGHMMAVLDTGLQSFAHPAMNQGHKWQLTLAGAVRPFVKYVESEAAPTVDEVLGHFEKAISEKLMNLPHSVIHNDANFGNVLVNNNEDGRPVVDGLIDFGDVCYQPTVCEAAIALAYVIIDRDDPLSACQPFLEAYGGLCALGTDDISVLFDLIKTRLAVSIAIAAERRHQDPDDLLGQQDKQPAMRALSQLVACSADEAESLFRQACGMRK